MNRWANSTENEKLERNQMAILELKSIISKVKNFPDRLKRVLKMKEGMNLN